MSQINTSLTVRHPDIRSTLAAQELQEMVMERGGLAYKYSRGFRTESVMTELLN